MSRNTLSARLRQRRQRIEFERALNSASPSMRSELLAAAARQQAGLR
jgi:hypothetical protein